MDSDNYNDRDKKRNRPIPLIFWFGGALLTGGLITFAVLNSKKGEQVKLLGLRLAETENTLTREKEELSEKLVKSTASYDALQTEHIAAIASLNDEQSKNSRLAAANASYIKRENQVKQEYQNLLESSDRVIAENEMLKSEAEALKSSVADLQSKLNKNETLSSMQSELISSQNSKIRSDSMATAALLDSLERENVAGFYNNTDITAAAGLEIRNVPYTKYFYGFSTVNGYVINKHFMTGIGIGVNIYNGGVMVPIFLDMRYTFNKRTFTPYLFADGGVLIPFESDLQKPSLFVNPGIGISRNIGKKLALNFGAGYYLQRDAARNSFVNAKIGLIYRKK